MAAPPAPAPNAAIYTRISQDATGQKAGVTRQLKDSRALAKRLKWKVVDTYDDNDTSAYDGSVRKGFERLLADINSGRIDAIVCWHPDRLYRRIKDLQRLVDLADRGVTIASVNGGELDLSNATGKMLARILGSVAEQESEHKGERRVAANKDRATNGAWRADGPRVFGYTQGGNGEQGGAAGARGDRRAAGRHRCAGRPQPALDLHGVERTRAAHPQGPDGHAQGREHLDQPPAAAAVDAAGLRRYADVPGQRAGGR